MNDTGLALTARKTAIVLLMAGVALLVVQLASVLLLVFAAVLVAVLVRMVGKPFARLGLGSTASVLLGGLLIALVLTAIGWLFGRQINSQFDNVATQLPAALQQARGWLATLPFGDALANATPDMQGAATRAASFAFGIVGVVTNLVLVLIAGIYFALEPDLYVKGVRRLFPKVEGERVSAALLASGTALKKYLLAQFAAMACIGTMVGVGLWIIGVPSAIALGLIVAIANFVPLIGPFVGAVPGLLIAFAESPELGLWAAVVYLVAQQIDGNVLTPMMQRWAVSIPPALLLFALAAFGVLFGVLGVVLAAPLTVVIYTLVTILWARRALGYAVATPGESSGA